MRTSIALLLFACNNDPAESDAPDSDVADTDDTDPADTDSAPEVPTGAADLVPWLTAGSYTIWAAEPAPHASTGPHFGRVRTFFNPALDASLRAGASAHPVGSATVKELYGDGDTVRGWAVMVKVKAGSSGSDWYWYESFGAQTYADGEGVGLCTGCHGGGDDFVLTPWP